jgi:hypothetical protein
MFGPETMDCTMLRLSSPNSGVFLERMSQVITRCTVKLVPPLCRCNSCEEKLQMQTWCSGRVEHSTKFVVFAQVSWSFGQPAKFHEVLPVDGLRILLLGQIPFLGRTRSHRRSSLKAIAPTRTLHSQFESVTSHLLDSPSRRATEHKLANVVMGDR